MAIFRNHARITIPNFILSPAPLLYQNILFPARLHIIQYIFPYSRLVLAFSLFYVIIIIEYGVISVVMSYIYIILAAISWASIGIFANNLSALGFSSLQISLLRSVVSLIVVSAFMLIRDRKAFKVSLRDIPLFAAMGLFSSFFCNICYFRAIQLTGVAIAAVLMYTAPVFVLIASAVLFKEKLNAKKIVAVVFAILGCSLVSGVLSSQSNASFIGIIWGIGSGLAYASYSIFSVFALRKYSPSTVLFYMFAFSCAAAMLIQNPAEVFVALTDTRTLLFTIGLGVVSTTVPFALYTIGLLKVAPSKASVIATVEPATAAIFGVALFSEMLDLSKIIGIVLIISASIVINSRFERANK